MKQEEGEHVEQPSANPTFAGRAPPPPGRNMNVAPTSSSSGTTAATPNAGAVNPAATTIAAGTANPTAAAANANYITFKV